MEINVDNTSFITTVGSSASDFFSGFGGIISLVIGIPLALWLIKELYEIMIYSSFMVKRREMHNARELEMPVEEYREMKKLHYNKAMEMKRKKFWTQYEKDLLT